MDWETIARMMVQLLTVSLEQQQVKIHKNEIYLVCGNEHEFPKYTFYVLAMAFCTENLKRYKSFYRVVIYFIGCMTYEIFHIQSEIPK